MEISNISVNKFNSNQTLVTHSSVTRPGVIPMKQQIQVVEKVIYSVIECHPFGWISNMILPCPSIECRSNFIPGLAIAVQKESEIGCPTTNMITFIFISTCNPLFFLFYIPTWSGSTFSSNEVRLRLDSITRSDAPTLRPPPSRCTAETNHDTTATTEMWLSYQLSDLSSPTSYVSSLQNCRGGPRAVIIIQLEHSDMVMSTQTVNVADSALWVKKELVNSSDDKDYVNQEHWSS